MFKAPEMDIVRFVVEDVITTSGGPAADGGTGTPSEDEEI